MRSTIPHASRITVYKIDGLPGTWEKITKKEAKDDQIKPHVQQALYGDGSLGYFVPYENGSKSSSETSPTATVTKPAAAESAPAQ